MALRTIVKKKSLLFVFGGKDLGTVLPLLATRCFKTLAEFLEGNLFVKESI